MAGWGGLPPCSLPNLKAHIANRTGEEGAGLWWCNKRFFILLLETLIKKIERSFTHIWGTFVFYISSHRLHIANHTGKRGWHCGDVISVSSYRKFTLETMISTEKRCKGQVLPFLENICLLNLILPSHIDSTMQTTQEVALWWCKKRFFILQIHISNSHGKHW